MRVMAAGEFFDGSPVEIVEAMKAKAWGAENMALPEYIKWAIDNARRLTGAKVEDVDPTKPSELQCEAFIRAVQKSGLLVLLEG